MSRVSGSHLILLCFLLLIRLVHCLVISLCHFQILRCVWRCHTSVTVALARTFLPENEAYFGTLLLTYGSIPYGVSSIRGYVLECASSTVPRNRDTLGECRTEIVTKSIT